MNLSNDFVMYTYWETKNKVLELPWLLWQLDNKRISKEETNTFCATVVDHVIETKLINTFEIELPLLRTAT